MTSKFILMPLDGSALAEAAVPYAAALAGVDGAAIEILAVVQDLTGMAHREQLESLVADGLRGRLHAVAEHLRAKGLAVETVVRYGDPAEVILAHAAERARLVVMTSRGLGGVERWLLGSVADEVVRLASCPVLVVRPSDAAAASARPWGPRRVLVPLDGSALAEAALPLAFRWAAGFSAEVLLVQAQPWLATQLAAADGYLPDLGRWDEEAAQAAMAYLQERGQAAPQGVTVRTVVLRGEPAGCLLNCAEDERADLIVMSSHGRGGLGRLALGSVADRLMRHGPAVCIVHPHGVTEERAGLASPATTAGAARQTVAP